MYLEKKILIPNFSYKVSPKYYIPYKSTNSCIDYVFFMNKNNKKELNKSFSPFCKLFNYCVADSIVSMIPAFCKRESKTILPKGMKATIIEAANHLNDQRILFVVYKTTRI